MFDDAVFRAEQSRFSYTMHTEELRLLNVDLQTYLNDIQRIDDENRRLQENIDEIRSNYLATLENHLERLPEDFRRGSEVLTDAHLERYKSKSRAKRFINEREELKKRIHFLATNDKDQIKRLNNLQKQQRQVDNQLQMLNEQMQNLNHRVQTEKQAHQQAMDTVDRLHIDLEEICVERSKREFEIQTLREEVKLMQTAKEFLDEEQQTILSTQTEANEYFFSHLNESISRLREDFNELQKNQLRQIENEYEQLMKILEENLLANQTIDETMINQQRAVQIEYEKLQNDHRSAIQELTILNDLNQVLSEQVAAMETDLSAKRDHQRRELFDKNDQFEQNHIELETLNARLNHLAEYDRNLKFELTLYRGVLESEYRRKQQLTRPTTLRTMTNKSHRNSLKNFVNRNQLETLTEKTDTQSDEIVSISSHSDLEKSQSQDGVDQQEVLVSNSPLDDRQKFSDTGQSTQFGRRSSPTEELIDSSEQNLAEKENRTDFISSAGYYGTSSTHQEPSRQSSPQILLTNVEDDNTDLIIPILEVDSRSSRKIDEDNQSNLESVIQDLRYVYRHLVNDDDLVEINDHFPDNLIDRLEFGDNLIRILFDNLLRKYIVQPMKSENRSNTLDWTEFRNILFPILTGRYTEGHLRNLFNLFNINQRGYLSCHELAEMLELLQVNNSNEYAERMTDKNGKLNIDEFIESVRKTDDINKNLLAEEIESKQWYIQHPFDEEQSEIQSLHSPSRIHNGIILLSRIFRRVGADFENRQLDSHKHALSMRITNEFVHNNIDVSSDDLQTFIEAYLKKKQTSDHLINWTEFRDVFLPLVNGGMVSRDDLTRWFDILDIHRNQIITSEQILHLLRLLQLINPENILNRIHAIFPKQSNFWTIAEFNFALENLDETITRLLSSNDESSSYDLDWLRKNIQ